jgi:hypothetical protein
MWPIHVSALVTFLTQMGEGLKGEETRKQISGLFSEPNFHSMMEPSLMFL